MTNEQVIKKEVEDVKEQANEGAKKSKEKDEKEKKETLVKKEVTPKEGWMRQKWKKWRRSNNPQGKVYLADKIIFRPPGKAAKVIWSQNSVSETGPPKAPIRQSKGRRMGQTKQEMSLLTGQVTQGTKT